MIESKAWKYYQLNSGVTPDFVIISYFFSTLQILVVTASKLLLPTVTLIYLLVYACPRLSSGGADLPRELRSFLTIQLPGK
jgi:hypothetical protein